jgi:hypothetical protein
MVSNSDSADNLPFMEAAELSEPTSTKAKIFVEISVAPGCMHCNDWRPPCELLVWNGVGGYSCARFGSLTSEHAGPPWPDPASRIQVLRAFDCLEAERGGVADG